MKKSGKIIYMQKEKGAGGEIHEKGNDYSWRGGVIVDRLWRGHRT